MLGVPAHGAGQHRGLDLAADGDHLPRAGGVAYAAHVLLDDRAVVEVGGDVMGGGADQLDAAGVRLVVGPRALEARQEGVVDVDAFAGEPRAHLGAQHLHVAGEHHEVDLKLADQAQERGLLPGTGFLGDGEMVERDAVPFDEIAGGLVIGDDRRDLDVECPRLPAVQQIDQAMVELGDRDQHPRLAPPVPHLPIEPHVPGDAAEGGAEGGLRGGRQAQMHAHEEDRGLLVAIGDGVADVAARGVERGGDRRHDARPVRAAEGKDQVALGLGHRRGASRRWSTLRPYTRFGRPRFTAAPIPWAARRPWHRLPSARPNSP